MSRHVSYRPGLLIVFILITVASVNAQSVIYDWRSNASVPEAYPTIRRKQMVTFRIRNVNKILYTYRLEITQTPIPSNDASHIADLLRHFRSGPPPAGAAPPSPCEIAQAAAETATNQAIAAINGDTRLPVGYAGTSPHVSVALSDSVAAWASHRAAIVTAFRAIADYRAQCTAEISSSPQLNQLFSDFETTATNMDAQVRAAADNPDFVAQYLIEPGMNVSVTVYEMFKQETIKTKTFSFPGVDVLTLSAGALFSRIPDRTYEARKSPTSELNVLTVEGNSRATPALAALLNYSLGAIRLDGNTAGLALSAGPVLKLGNQSESSSFGFFAGLSGHLYHRFYITPGFHFGQFADFPVGFNNGSTVPANFGQLDPVKRWTARFGLALTFKTNDFSGLTSSDEPEVTGSEAQPRATPAPSPSPSPGPDTETTSLNMSNAPLSVARDFLRPPPRQVTPAVAEPIVETRTQVPPRQDLNRPAERPQVATPETRRMISSTAASSITRVTSIINSRPSEEGERIFFEAGTPIRDWSAYFRNGRFFLTIPRAQLDVIQDGLSGRSYTDAMFERRGDDLIISFILSPGTKARVLDTANGLALDFFSSNN